MSVPLPVQRVFWIERMRFWYILLSHDDDPYAIEEYGVKPGDRLPDGRQMPTGPAGRLPEGLPQRVEYLPHYPAYEDVLRGVDILPHGDFEAIGSQALGLVSRFVGWTRIINPDRLILPPATFNRTRYRRSDPQRRWRNPSASPPDPASS